MADAPQRKGSGKLVFIQKSVILSSIRKRLANFRFPLPLLFFSPFFRPRRLDELWHISAAKRGIPLSI